MSHLTKLQAALKQAHAEAVIVSSELNQRYLSGLNYTDGYVVVLQDKAFLLADFRYIEVAHEIVDESEMTVIMPSTSMIQAVAELLKEHHVVNALYEEETLSCAMFKTYEQSFTGVTLVSGGSAMLEQLRMIKDEKEIEMMQRAQDITDAAFTHILEFINPDRTELDVALEIEFFMRAHGSEGTAFDTIAVSGSNSSRPHGEPRPVKLEKGFLTMDFGARFNGYCADMTRTVVIGKADEDMKRLYNTVAAAQTAAINALKPGMGCVAMDKIARDIIDEAGYKGAFGHGLGHAVGLYIHENPRLHYAYDPAAVLKAGNVITAEPGIYLEGKYGCRIEDMLVITEDGARDFAHSPKQLFELC